LLVNIGPFGNKKFGYVHFASDTSHV
jgi:hypothetical protein